jgi:hypothetical protein
VRSAPLAAELVVAVKTNLPHKKPERDEPGRREPQRRALPS